MAALELGVLVSGQGSNLQAILDAVSAGRLDARVRLVISNRADAFALERAAKAGVPACTIAHRDHATREAFDAALVAALRQADVGLVVLAGFMRVLTPTFLDAFPGRVLNVHPSLLPAFPGAHALRDALAFGVKVTGVTVHLVDEGVDTGPIVAQRALTIDEGESEASLLERLHVVEHELLVDSIARFAAGEATLVPGADGRRGHVRVVGR